MKKQTLIDALEIVKPGLASREVIEQSTSFAFMDGRVVTYNDEISLSHPVEDLEVEGAVGADELYQILKKIKVPKKDEDEIELTAEGNEIRINSGRSKIGLTLQAKIKLPLEEIDEIDEWHELPKEFMEAMRFAAMVCSRNNTDPKLTCIHASDEGFIEGSDNSRLARFTVDEGGFPWGTFLLPATSAMEVAKLEPTQISKTESWIHFCTEEDTIMSCRIFEDDYPDATKILEVTGVEISFPKTISDILDRASVFAKREATMDEEVTVIMEDNRVVIRGESTSGWFEEDANTKYKEDPMRFAVIPSLLKDILPKTKTCTLGEHMLKFEGAGWEYVVSLIIPKQD